MVAVGGDGNGDGGDVEERRMAGQDVRRMRCGHAVSHGRGNGDGKGNA